MTHILVVDDEPAVRRALERALRLDKYEVELAIDGEEALDRLAEQPADAVILDVMMPGVDGLEVCRRMRAAGDKTPVLMLTARDAIDDRVLGSTSAPTTTSSNRSLCASCRRGCARCCAGWAMTARARETLRFADLVLDPVAHEVYRGERLVELSKTEFLLLELSSSTRARC